jgi:D-cysteine desulfhydrase
MEHSGSQLETLKEKLQRVPRLALGYYPTPLVEAKVLSRVLGGPRILVKRDDLSGLALGGNKCRHIEFLMGYAKNNGYDIIVYGRGHKKKTQSNYAVQLTSAAQKAGIDVKIYMRGEPPVSPIFSGNDLLQEIIAPEITWLNESNQETFVLRILEEAQKLKLNGRNPWVMQTMYQNSTSIEQNCWSKISSSAF